MTNELMAKVFVISLLLLFVVVGITYIVVVLNQLTRWWVAMKNKKRWQKEPVQRVNGMTLTLYKDGHIFPLTLTTVQEAVVTKALGLSIVDIKRSGMTIEMYDDLIFLDMNDNPHPIIRIVNTSNKVRAYSDEKPYNGSSEIQ